MSHFVIRFEGGDEIMSFGPSELLGGMTPQYQTPTGYTVEDSFLVVTYDGGAKRRIPLHRVIDILEG